MNTLIRNETINFIWFSRFLVWLAPFFYLFGRKKMARLETEGENSQEPFWRFVDCFYKCDLSQIPLKIIEYQRLFGCFFFCHSIFVTHHSKIPCLFGKTINFIWFSRFHMKTWKSDRLACAFFLFIW